MKKTVRKTASGAPDGRELRSRRSRQQIIDAVLALCGEGTLVPTAQQVAQRACVGIRSVFRHFSDMEALYLEMDRQLVERYRGLFLGGRREGTLAERIARMVSQRVRGFEVLAPFVRSTQAQSWASPALQSTYARQLRGLRQNLFDWIPELQALPAPAQQAVEAASSFETWDRLRRHQRLSKQAATQTMNHIVTCLLR